jgi:glycine/D-amino acid oxidase-like deaminating enzyme
VTTDVAVMGGGIVGTAAATFLAEAGLSVTLYESTDIAAGASGRNSGVIQHPFDPVLVSLYEISLALYRALAANPIADFVLPAEPAGLLAVGWDETSASSLAHDWLATYPATAPEVVVGSALRNVEPSLADGVVACRLAIGYPVAPAAATRGFAAVAVARGARIRLGDEVRLALRDGAVEGVEAGGRIEPAGVVVVAAGPWTPSLVDPSGAWAPIGRSWGVVADIRLPDAPAHVLEELALEIEPDDGAGSTPGAPGVGDVGFSLVTAAGASSLGSTFLDAAPDAKSYVLALRERGARYVPAIADADVRGVRACARPVSLDGRPLVGPVPGLGRAFIAAGNGPWGISTGPGTARLLADLILGIVPGPPAALDPARFGTVAT